MLSTVVASLSIDTSDTSTASSDAIEQCGTTPLPKVITVIIIIIIIIIIIVIICRSTDNTATEAGAVANKIVKYDELASTHIFYPVAIETGGTCNHCMAVEHVDEIGRRATLITGEPRESTFLF